MNFSQAISTCLSKYANFSGRASRPEFWWFFLFMLLVTVAASMVSELFGGLASLALLLPSIAATARRLHDTGKSGWWQLVGVVPLIGWAVVIYWLAQPADGAGERYDVVPA